MVIRSHGMCSTTSSPAPRSTRPPGPRRDVEGVERPAPARSREPKYRRTLFHNDCGRSQVAGSASTRRPLDGSSVPSSGGVGCELPADGVTGSCPMSSTKDVLRDGAHSRDLVLGDLTRDHPRSARGAVNAAQMGGRTGQWFMAATGTAGLHGTPCPSRRHHHHMGGPVPRQDCRAALPGNRWKVD